jgi:hypothetical protein
LNVKPKRTHYRSNSVESDGSGAGPFAPVQE